MIWERSNDDFDGRKMINVDQISQKEFGFMQILVKLFTEQFYWLENCICPEMTITVNLQVFSGKYFRVGCLTVTDPGDSDIIKTHTAAEQK